MRRTLMEQLRKWKDSPLRKPLLLKGIRQVGKTYLLMDFGNEAYHDVACFNFEGNPALAERFKGDFDPKRILTELGILHGKALVPGETLIIFDEIQFCPEAITALKYFQEGSPDYHIVCAGSLLGIALSRPTSYPVGKVDVMTLRPMNFQEFLLACGEEMLVEYLSSEAPKLTPVSAMFVDRLVAHLRNYMIVGGMPEAVATWLRTQDISAVDTVQRNILSLYELDFAKHSPASDIPKLNMIWNSIPSQLAKINGKFVYGLLRQGAGARAFENAMTWLQSAGMVHKVHQIEKPALPLKSYARNSYFKLYVPDVGLLRRMANLSAKSILEEGALYQEFKGALTENYCLQELVTQLDDTPFYWNSGNTAEVDFVAQFTDKIVPIEVKAATNVRAKSLMVYREKYRPPVMVRSSLRNLGYQDGILSCPHYLLWGLTDILKGIVA